MKPAGTSGVGTVGCSKKGNAADLNFLSGVQVAVSETGLGKTLVFGWRTRIKRLVESCMSGNFYQIFSIPEVHLYKRYSPAPIEVPLSTHTTESFQLNHSIFFIPLKSLVYFFSECSPVLIRPIPSSSWSRWSILSWALTPRQRLQQSFPQST